MEETKTKPKEKEKFKFQGETRKEYINRLVTFIKAQEDLKKKMQGD